MQQIRVQISGTSHWKDLLVCSRSGCKSMLELWHEPLEGSCMQQVRVQIYAFSMNSVKDLEYSRSGFKSMLAA